VIRALISRLLAALGWGDASSSRGVAVEELQAEFQARYHHFKLLLSANSEALEAMTLLEEALHGQTPFGMHFLRATLTRLSSSVSRIIHHLEAIAPGKYTALLHQFQSIRHEVSPLLASNAEPPSGPLTLPLSSISRNDVDRVGAKMANLGELRNRLDIPVPDGFTATAAAYAAFLSHDGLGGELDRMIQARSMDGPEALHSLSSSLQERIIMAELPSEISDAIMAEYEALASRLASAPRLAVRSSALGEDEPGLSFAGQYRSELNVGRDNLLLAYKEVVAAKYSPQAMSYRLNKGVRDEDVLMCAGFLCMVQAAAGGVAYSRNPASMSDTAMVVNAALGLPKSVVDGAAPSDMYVVKRKGGLHIQSMTIADKNMRQVCREGEGIFRQEVGAEEAMRPALAEEEILELAELVLRLEQYFGRPQDVEWALDQDRRMVFLQCRPLYGGPRAPFRGDKGVPANAQRLASGVCASPGVAAGPVVFVKKDADALSFPEGGVLVLGHPLPRFASLLGRAAAVAAEQGAITGHLANVAREFQVPAVFGAPGVMGAVREGEEVTVDADAGLVLRGRVERLLESRPKARNVMEGSSVLAVLRSITPHVLPLHLVDPDAPEFKPAWCKTFHDITRFCHEKAVVEMFRFGREQNFPERRARQLVTDAPMQFWVLDLDDGLADGEWKPTVHISDVRSIPMLALWRGMSAIPWPGPPRVNPRGFLAVLYEASANPELDPSMASSYNTRNYFMVARSFVSLQSRFGFHFSSVEALVSDRRSENYASFRFKGGAADAGRRTARVRLIGQLLEEQDFRIRLREDCLEARLDGRPAAEMEKRLMALGYLIIHTRQLDMIMNNPNEAAAQRTRIRSDLDQLFQS